MRWARARVSLASLANHRQCAAVRQNSKLRRATAGSGSPSACHGWAVACIGQPPPPSAPGPVIWGWQARPLPRGCGGRAFARVDREGEGPKFPRAAARPAGYSGLNLGGLLINCRSLRAWPGFAYIHCPAAVLPVRKCSCTARIRAAPKAPSPSPAVIQFPDLAITDLLL